MQHSSQDAALHMQTDQTVIKNGKKTKKEKLESLFCFNHSVNQ